MKETLILRWLTTFISALLLHSLALGQGQLLGGPCEGCEAVFEFGNRDLSPVDTLPEFDSEGTQIKLTGTVFNTDGNTPASGVILYIYQTNEEGVYPKKGTEKGWARRHGYLRGWIKTAEDGSYTFFTQKPEFYGSNPAHIHLTVLEPGGEYYYIEDFLFSGDDNLKKSTLNNAHPRGGSNSVLTLIEEGGILTGNRDIVLRKNL